MEALKQILPLLLTLSLAGLVMTVGLKAGHGDLLYVLRRPGLLIRAILAVEVIPPIAAAAMVWVLPLEPAVKAGIMLMAISPVPPLVPGKQLSIGARKEYAYGVYLAMALLTIIAVPLVFDLAARLFGQPRTLPFHTIAATVATGVLIPLGLGMLVRRIAPDFAERIVPWVYRLSMLLVLLVFFPILATIWPAIRSLIGDGAVIAMAALTLVTLIGGHMLGGPADYDRATLAVASSVRHPGIAMLIANTTFADKRVTAAVLLYLLVSMIMGALYQAWFKHRYPAARPA
ncbi:BASS family bile acid:Na+ symporter [Phenylobacterium haematophilum]|jgi:BASS family bile acid:Na+ symporter|uniref:BASS family bile acid:Na+ symporter n=1 Tax=Phenylobacterium haematophilum TaxID=98513 RepID=A0A840A3U3_9CAUL|nr:Na+-dependent transporter [Phenylobacterium haematophilum]MBB3892151.1 BASS family bile acid:Na+ symporter [Phenylobacterium haematophilum]